MKKFISTLTAIILLVVSTAPLQVLAASDRIIGRNQNNDLYMKEGPLNSQWVKIANGGVPASISVSGSRVGYVDYNDPLTPVYLKEPNITSVWQNVFHGTGGSDSVFDEKTCLLSNNQYRLLVAYYDGGTVDKLFMKDGPYNAGWKQLDLSGGSSIYRVVCAADRVGVVFFNGSLVAKTLTPGQFTDPDNVAWLTQATDVAFAEMTANRIAYVDFNNYDVFVKDGPLNTPWYGNHAVIFDNLDNMVGDGEMRIGGDRICIINLSYDLMCKQGGPGAKAVLTKSSAVGLGVSNDRIVVNDLDSTNTWALEGPLYGPNSGWVNIDNNQMVETAVNNWAY
jgi:hypothetical protein